MFKYKKTHKKNALNNYTHKKKLEMETVERLTS